MIGLLRGHIIEKQPPHLMLEVQGVGYEIQAPMSTFYNLPIDNTETVTLHIHMIVREDAQLLYGFTQQAERTLFRTLLKINGVGGKMALAILSGMTANEFQQAVQAGDVATLTKLPGVGKKTAERLIVEMKDRFPASMATDNAAETNQTPQKPAHSAKEDAMGALLALGYKPAEAQRMLNNIACEDLSVEMIIRQALQTIR